MKSRIVIEGGAVTVHLEPENAGDRAVVALVAEGSYQAQVASRTFSSAGPIYIQEQARVITLAQVERER